MQQGGSFLLGNLPPGEALTIFAVTDANDDGVIGQVGEQRTEALGVTARSASVQDLQFGPLQTLTVAQPLLARQLAVDVAV